MAKPNKDYRVVSKDPLKRGAVIRLRAFFGVSDKSIIKIVLETGGNRSSTAPAWWFLREPRLSYYEDALKADVGRLGGGGSDSDTVHYDWHTLSHEFGHVLGFPDCYVEFYDRDIGAIVSYQLDITNLMCSRRGHLQQRHYDELEITYSR